MKKLLIVLVILLIPALVTAQHFTPVGETGLPYSVFISIATFNGDTLEVGDEVGVYDEDECVGAAVFEGEFTLVVTCWQADQGLPGFTPGNPILCRIWINGAELELDPVVNVTTGTGNFGYTPFTVVELTAEYDQPLFQWNMSEIDFGQQLTESTSDTTLTLYNLYGGNNLNISSIVSSNAAFSTSHSNLNIASGDSAQITISFTPPSENTYEADLTFTTNDTLHNPVTINLNGIGDDELSPIITISHDTLFYDITILGETSTINLEIGNEGGEILNIYSMMSTWPGVFGPELEGDTTVAVGSSIIVPVHFTPQEAVPYQANIYIYNDDMNNPQISLPAFGSSELDLAPEQFTLVSPDDNGTFLQHYIDFVWNSTIDNNTDDIVSYSLEVSQNPEFSNPFVVANGADTTRRLGQAFLDIDIFYYWRVVASDLRGNTTNSYSSWSFILRTNSTDEIELHHIPEEFSISNAYPNPFNSQVNLEVAIPTSENVKVLVYNTLGEVVYELSNEYLNAGFHHYLWKADNQAAGIYFIRALTESGNSTVRKILLVK